MSRVIGPSEWRSQRWKSGSGTTNEIVRWPADAEDYDVRVSVAEVGQAGPFSTFPGYRRWSVLLAGASIELLTPDVAYLLDTVGDLVELDGTTSVTALVPDGPAHLLNVLGKPGTRVGIGASHGPVRFAFAVAATGALDRWHARVFEPPAPVDDAMTVWIA